jgi:hypothetical protein
MALFSRLRGRVGDNPPVLSGPDETLTADNLAASSHGSFPLNGAPTQADTLVAMQTALAAFLPPSVPLLPDPNVSTVKVEEKLAGLGNYIGQEAFNQFSIVLKGGRLEASVRFQLWAATPNAVDQAIDELHGRLLNAKTDLQVLGFLRFAAESSTLAEFIPPLNAWRRTADYFVLYEFRYTDSDGAQSLIARIPIHTDPEELESPQRETAVITDEMARWDDLAAPTLVVHGRQTVGRFSALSFVPGIAPSGPVMLLRTFSGATDPPQPFPDLDQWVTAVTHPTNPERHAQVTFATFNDFLALFIPTGGSITLGDWDEDATPDDYTSLLLELATPLALSDRDDSLQLVYQPGNANPHFDQTAVFYIRAG